MTRKSIFSALLAAMALLPAGAMAQAMDDPECTAPTAVGISGLTNESVTVSWIDSGSAGTYRVTLNGEVAATVADTFAAVSVDADADYTVGVSKLCDGQYTAESTYFFHTPCVPISHAELPWSKSFDTVNNVGTSTTVHLQIPCLAFAYRTGSYAIYPYANANYHYGASGNGLYFSADTSLAREYVALPLFEDDVADLMVSFQMYGNNASHRLEVGVMSDPGNAETFVPVDTVGLTANGTWEYKKVLFDTYSGDGRFIAIGPLPGTNANLSIDNLCVSMAPSCIGVQGVEVSDITDSSAVVTIVDSTYVGHYRLAYSAYGADTTEIELSDGAMSVALTGLAAPRGYTLTVSSVCAEGYVTDPVGTTFRTVVAPVTELPYSCGFEAGQDSLWDLFNGAVNGWYVDTAASNGGAKALYISKDNGHSNTYVTSPATASMAVRSFVLEAGEYTISFDWRTVGESIYDYLRAVIVPDGYVFEGGVKPAGFTATSVPDGWIDLGGRLNMQGYWQTVDTAFSIDTGGTYALTFIWVNDAGGGIQPPAAIDNVLLDALSCPRITDLAATSVGSDAIGISWHAGGLESLWAVGIGDSTFVVDDTACTIGGLDSLTTYTVTVRAVCGDGDTSASRTVTVQTLQVVYTGGIPYSTGFESGDDLGWLLVNGAVNAWTIGAAVADSGSASLYISCDSGITNNYNTAATSISYAVRTIRFDTAGDYVASFDWRCYGESQFDYLRAWIAPGSATFAADKLPNGYTVTGAYTTITPDGWIDLADGQLNMQGDWQHMAHDFTLADSGEYSVVFMWANSSYEGIPPAAAVDNLLIRPLTCPVPTDLTLDSTDIASLSFHWTAGGDESLWEVRVGDAAPVVVDTASYTATGLDAGVFYDVRVRAICGEGDTSLTVGSPFRTGCMNVELPYNEDFEGFEVGVAPMCWEVVVPFESEYETFPAVFQLDNHAHSGNQYLCGSIDREAEQLFFTTPVISTDADSLNVSFWTRLLQEGGSYRARIQVGVMTDPADTSTFTAAIDTTAGVYSWKRFSFGIRLEGNSGTAVVAFRLLQASATYNADSYFYIDDLSVSAAASPCDAPAITGAIGAAGSVTLTWTSTADNHEVAIVKGDWSEPGETASVSGTQYTFTGLSADTQYTAGVRAVCGDGVFSDWTTRTVTTGTEGVGKVTVLDFGLYPNPASATVRVEVNGEARVAIIDQSGRKVVAASANGGTDLDISQLAKGAYFVRVSTAEGSAVRKLIVR